jgi:NitT/TauT family transport system permease protein
MEMAQQTRELVQVPVLSAPKRWEAWWRGFVTTMLPPALVLLAVAIAWESFVITRDVPEFVLPRPTSILLRLVQRPGYFFIENGALTLFEALAGFFSGGVTAIVLAAIMARSRLVERSLFPVALLIKATPIVVIAPLLIIWFGYGVAGKIIMAALICFFPILVNTIVGLRSVNPTALEFLESVSASEWEIFTQLRVPTALPYVLASFKISVSLAVIGAVVAEWAGASQGLGRVIIYAGAQFDQLSVFAGVLVLAIMGIGLTAVISWLERRFLYWHESVIVG